MIKYIKKYCCCFKNTTNITIPLHSLQCLEVMQLYCDSTKEDINQHKIYMILSEFKALPLYIINNINTASFMYNYDIISNKYGDIIAYNTREFQKSNNIMFHYCHVLSGTSNDYVGFKFKTKN